MRMTDAGSGSTMALDDSGTIETEIVDVFPILEGKEIDVLKIDIEGGEYEILGDPRFERLKFGAIVMEWHSRGGGAADKLWCQERLQKLGYQIKEMFNEPTYGMFYGQPASPPHQKA
jgi:hypothetical protein